MMKYNAFSGSGGKETNSGSSAIECNHLQNSECMEYLWRPTQVTCVMLLTWSISVIECLLRIPLYIYFICKAFWVLDSLML